LSARHGPPSSSPSAGVVAPATSLRSPSLHVGYQHTNTYVACQNILWYGAGAEELRRLRICWRFMHFSGALTAFWLAGCGVSQELYLARTTELDRCQTDLSRTQGDLTSSRQKGEDLANESSELRDRLTT